MGTSAAGEQDVDIGLTCLVLRLRSLADLASPMQSRHRFANAAATITSSDILRSGKDFNLKPRVVSANWTRLAKSLHPVVVTHKQSCSFLVAKASEVKALGQDAIENKLVTVIRAELVAVSPELHCQARQPHQGAADFQEVAIKLEVFPSTRSCTVPDKIKTVSPATVGEGVTQQQSSESGDRCDDKPAPVRPLAYASRVTLDRTTIKADGKDVHLISGVASTVEIKTGNRRTIEHLLSPRMKMTDEAGKER